MKVLDGVKWYSTFLYLFASILSFADPITDILMVMEFYRTDHAIWFGVGLTFVILPGLLLLIIQLIYFRVLSSADRCGFGESSQGSCLCSFHPFSAAWANVRVFILCLKNFKQLWRGDGINSDTVPDLRQDDSLNSEEKLIVYSGMATYVEALFESAPQFILQLYAMTVQEKQIEIIQIISLPISFLCLVWAFTVNEELFYAEETPFGLLSLKHKVLRFAVNLFIFSSRLFAITFFIVSYKWWIFMVYMSHFAIVFVMVLFNAKLSCMSGVATAGKLAIIINLCFLALILIIYSVLYWLKDASFSDCVDEECRKLFRKIHVPLKILAAVENLVMILLFYFSSGYSDTWYALPVTVCVCSLSALNFVINIISFCRRRRVEGVNMDKTEREDKVEEQHVNTAATSL
ncbi:XK-related protein 6-like [Oculina patagonica]